MPLLTRCFLKTAMLYFVASSCLGSYLLVAFGLRYATSPVWQPVYWHMLLVGWLMQLIFGVAYWMFWILLPAHIYLVLVGGVTQYALGVSYWILPRLAGKGRGNMALAWSSYWALNAAILLVALHPAVEVVLGGPAASATFVCGGLLQGVAAIAFAWHAWPCIRASQTRAR